MTLYQAYKKKRYADGGSVDAVTGSQLDPTQVAMTGAMLGTGIIDAVAKPDPFSGVVSRGAAAGKGVLQGAAVGAQFGPIGAGIGAVVGGAASLIGNNKARKAGMSAYYAAEADRVRAEREQSAARVATNPELLTGFKNSGYFAHGGGIHIKKENRGKFTAAANRAGMGVQAYAKKVLADPNASSTLKKRANFARNAAKWKHEDGGPLDAPLARMYMYGGNTTTLSSDSLKFNGPSHNNGGIQIPGASAEVEGGETAKGDYIFSKKLGFADQHFKLAKARGIIEKKPPTQERVNTLKRLNQRENDLVLAQEFMKTQMR